MTWRESIRFSGGMLRLGLAFMWSWLAASAVIYITRALITNQISLEAVGIYSAAFALSGMFTNYVISAMSAEYYPRLTAVCGDHRKANQTINEQVEIALLLAVPGLLATLSLAPWLVQLLYTAEFLPATDLLQWFILGCLGRVISWPLSYLMLAMAKGKWFAVVETFANVFHLIMIVGGVMALGMGLEGVAIAFAILYLAYTLVVFLVAKHLTGFAWSESSRRLFSLLLPLVFLTFFASETLPPWYATLFGVLTTSFSLVFCLRGLVTRVGTQHRISRFLARIPGLNNIVGLA